MSRPIRLRAIDDDDLRVIAACLQDGIVPIGDMAFLEQQQQFILIANRFKWEAAGQKLFNRELPTADRNASVSAAIAAADAEGETLVFERTHCVLKVSGISAVRRRNIDVHDRGLILNLLTLIGRPEGMMLVFAGDRFIQLDALMWDCRIEDIGEPWPTTHCPSHKVDNHGRPLARQAA